jgi:hypothetical protein
LTDADGLEHYFEMSRPDTERALQIYKTFSAQTEEVVKFLGVARHFESATRLEIPNLKHASTELTQLLEDDLNDPDFELRRREYQIQKEAKKGGRGTAPALSKSTEPARPHTASASKPSQAVAPKPESKAPAPDLIDFFESIEQNQQPMAQQMSQQHPQQQTANIFQAQTGFQQPTFQPQQTGFVPQQAFQQQPQQTGFVPQQTGFGTPFNQQGTNPFAPSQAPQPLQPTPTGAGFGGYTPQPQSYGFQSSLPPIPQNGLATFPPQQAMANGSDQQTTNPFRQSMLVSHATGGPVGTPRPLTRQNTNPFAKRASTVGPQFRPGSSGLPPLPSQPPSFQQQNETRPVTQPLQIQRTGTNPFARNSPAPQAQQQQTLQPLRPNPTGSTNPFRQSAFVNQQTGQGWHVSGQQGTMGGLEQLDTVPIFPRPGLT